MYAAQLHDIVLQHGVQLHSFADDSQLVRHMYVRDIAVAKKDMVQCIADIEASSSSSSCADPHMDTPLEWKDIVSHPILEMISCSCFRSLMTF